MRKFLGKLSLVVFVLLATISIVFLGFTDKTNAAPKEGYLVYLKGEKIGFIRSKTALENYINSEQQALKDKYQVDAVYAPNGLDIQKHISYDEKFISEKDIYEEIKEVEPFTIKGYIATIKDNEVTQTVYFLNKNDFEDAIDKTITVFVNKDQYNSYLKDEQPVIETTGSIIENLELEQDIKIKSGFISTNERIFTDYKSLASYLLFGTTEEQAKYVIKPGDTIEKVAFDNKLGVEEFLIVNPNFTNQLNLLYPGQEVKIGLIKPILDVVAEKHVVEDQPVKFQTSIVYDNNLPFGKVEVRQAGIDGINRVTLKVKEVNGQIVTPVVVKKEVIKEPVNQVTVRGGKKVNSQIIVADNSIWAWPTIFPYVITSSYGWRWGAFHDGIDISGCGHGSPIYAANDGNIYSTGYLQYLGRYVMINHNNGYYTLYGHMEKSIVVNGQAVQRGQIVGTMGNTGRSTGTHLHFAVYVGEPYKSGSYHFNPLNLFR